MPRTGFEEIEAQGEQWLREGHLLMTLPAEHGERLLAGVAFRHSQHEVWPPNWPRNALELKGPRHNFLTAGALFYTEYKRLAKRGDRKPAMKNLGFAKECGLGMDLMPRDMP